MEKMEQQQQESRESGASSSLSATSPSFNSYSSENIADIAARVVHELNFSQNDDVYDDYFYSSLQQNYALHSVDDQNQNDAVEADNDDINNDGDDVDDDDEDSEFEFAVFAGEDTSSPISADEIFYNGQIKPIYPVFDTNLIFSYQNGAVSPVSRQSKTTSDNNNRTVPLRVPLRKLMSEERESRRKGSVSSTSSSEDGGELEGVPPGTYCVWAPKKKLSSEENGGEEEDIVTMKKKSNSTGAGSSKRWRFRDLIHRSNSDGKDTFVFLTPAHNHHHNNNHGKNQNGGEMKRREKVTAVNNNSIYGKKRAGEEEMKKKKSYLPYKQDLVGFFSNVNGLNRSIRPF